MTIALNYKNAKKDFLVVATHNFSIVNSQKVLQSFYHRVAGDFVYYESVGLFTP